MGRPRHDLFAHLGVPEWGPTSDTELFALFERYRAGTASRAEVEAYTRLLMSFVAMRFRQRKYLLSLPDKGLDPEVVAQEVLMNLLAKTRLLDLRHREPRVLLWWLGQRIRHFVVTQLERAKERRSRTAISATDLGTVGMPEGVGSADVIDGKFTGAVAPDNAAGRISRALRDAEDEALADVPGDVFALQKLYRLVCWQILHGGIFPHAKLRPRLRDVIRREQYNLIVARVRRRAWDAAAAVVG
jgi:hypothetical protein